MTCRGLLQKNKILSTFQHFFLNFNTNIRNTSLTYIYFHNNFDREFFFKKCHYFSTFFYNCFGLQNSSLKFVSPDNIRNLIFRNFNSLLFFVYYKPSLNYTFGEFSLFYYCIDNLFLFKIYICENQKYQMLRWYTGWYTKLINF